MKIAGETVESHPQIDTVRCECCNNPCLPFGLVTKAEYTTPGVYDRAGIVRSVVGRTCLMCYDEHLRMGTARDSGHIYSYRVAMACNRLALPIDAIYIDSPRCDVCRAELDYSAAYTGPTCPPCLSNRVMVNATQRHVDASSRASAEMIAAAIKEIRAAVEENRKLLVQAKGGSLEPETEKSMGNTQPPGEAGHFATIKADATDAAWRTAGSQLVKLTREPIAALLCRNLGPDDPALRARIAAFLQTELGAAIVSAVLSAGLSAMPTIQIGAGTQAVPERLARELRVRAMSGVGDIFADLLMGPLREVASTYLRGATGTLADHEPNMLNPPTMSAPIPFSLEVSPASVETGPHERSTVLR